MYHPNRYYGSSSSNENQYNTEHRDTQPSTSYGTSFPATYTTVRKLRFETQNQQNMQVSNRTPNNISSSNGRTHNLTTQPVASANTNNNNYNYSNASRHVIASTSRNSTAAASGTGSTTNSGYVAQATTSCSRSSTAGGTSSSDVTQNTTQSATTFGRLYGSTNSEKMFIFTGTVDKVLKWAKIFQNHFCYFEVIAAVVSVCDGSINFQKVLLLNDKKGPILQVVFYSNSTYLEIEDFHFGQYLRCVGRMKGPNILHAECIRNAKQEEIDNLQRLSCICDHAVSHFL